VSRGNLKKRPRRCTPVFIAVNCRTYLPA